MKQDQIKEIIEDYGWEIYEIEPDEYDDIEG